MLDWVLFIAGVLVLVFLAQVLLSEPDKHGCVAAVGCLKLSSAQADFSLLGSHFHRVARLFVLA